MAKEKTPGELVQEEEQSRRAQAEIAAAVETAKKQKAILNNSETVNSQSLRVAMELVQMTMQKVDAMAGLMEQERESMVKEREEYQTARTGVDVLLENLQESIDRLEQATVALILLSQQQAG